MNNATKYYMGVDYQAIFNGCDVWSYQDVQIKPSSNHSVLFKIPAHRDAPLEPYVREDRWDGNHVKMPNSDQSKYEIDQNGTKRMKNRFELIELSLLRTFETSYEFEQAVMEYNSSYKNQWNFSSLHFLVHEDFNDTQRIKFLSSTLPGIIGLALQIRHIIKCPIPLLKQGLNHSISMTQYQAACLLANAFICSFPRRNTEKRNAEYSLYPEINFNRLFGSNSQKSREKLKCILNYFDRVISNKSVMQKGVITYQRRYIENFPDWSSDERKLSDIKYHISSTNSIETAVGCLQVDFANQFVGGGVLGGGCVQEEIRFVINPELIVAKIFTECLADEEALIVTGAEQFSSYRGYASSMTFAGNFDDSTPRDDCNRTKCRIVAIDALAYKNYYAQFKERNLIREINKAYVGFANNCDSDIQPVATGLWGAGAFQGHPIKSALIQLIACRASRRNMIFCTFGDEVISKEVAAIFEFLTFNNVTIGSLIKILKKFMFSGNTNEVEQLNVFIKKEVISSAKSSSTTFPKFSKPSTSSDKFKQISLTFKSTEPKKHENTISLPSFDENSIYSSKDDAKKIQLNQNPVKTIDKPSLVECLDDVFNKM